MTETIVSVGIRQHDLLISLPAPARHGDVLKLLHLASGAIVAPQDQGFLTNTGRWVDRTEGAAIAIAAGQIEALKWPPYLYSEDLW